MDDSLAKRAERITPQEWRVIALSIEGVSPAAACEALGIAVGTLESHKQAIRRKLGIPKGERFEGFVRLHFGEGVVPPEGAAAKTAGEPRAPRDESVANRRVRWLLRITLEEMAELAASSGLRAQLLEQTVLRMGSDRIDEASLEVEDLRQIAADLETLKATSLARIRARGATVEGP